jgi:tryptophan 2,3-dioxygenase
MFNNWLWGSGGEVKSLWSIYVGLHMRYKGRNKEKLLLTLTQNSKNYQSSDCRLKLVYMKSESLVIVNHHVTVNDLSNFAHTAHHARRVVSAGHLSNCYRLYLWILNRTIKIFTWVVIEATRIFYLFTAKEYLLTA